MTRGRGATAEPSARATMIPVRDGLEVRAERLAERALRPRPRARPHGRPLARRLLPQDVWAAVLGFLGSWWIRRTAGIAQPPREPDPARYDAVNAHCDLLIVGAGPAGLQAAQVASRAGLTVILAEQDFECGGRLLATNTLINDAPVTAL